MNERLQQYARAYLKQALAILPDSNKLLFKRMYSNHDISRNINSIIDSLKAEQLDWAMQQVERSLIPSNGDESIVIDIFKESTGDTLDVVAEILYKHTSKYLDHNVKHAIADVRTDIIGLRNSL